LDLPARYLYALTHVLALICFVYARWWRRYPVLIAFVAVDSITALTYTPESKRWIADIYMRVEPITLALRLCCVLEALRLLAGEWRDRTWLLVATGLVGTCFAFLVAGLEPSVAVRTFVQIRRYVQIGTAVQILTGLSVLWMLGLLRWNLDSKHAAILAVLVVKQAVYSLLSIRGPWASMKVWRMADWPGLIVTSCCLLLWCWLALRRSSYRDGRAPHRADRGAS
jgi:hypothetical protein